jgi:hypothetical protein
LWHIEVWFPAEKATDQTPTSNISAVYKRCASSGAKCNLGCSARTKSISPGLIVGGDTLPTFQHRGRAI